MSLLLMVIGIYCVLHVLMLIFNWWADKSLENTDLTEGAKNSDNGIQDEWDDYTQGKCCYSTKKSDEARLQNNEWDN